MVAFIKEIVKRPQLPFDHLFLGKFPTFFKKDFLGPVRDSFMSQSVMKRDPLRSSNSS